MSQFKEVPASKQSVLKRRLVLGVGINDSPFMMKIMVDGKLASCPIYVKWNSMLTRCYSTKYQNDKPAYVGCTVVDKWLTFSNFKSWVEAQDWEGKELDKDILNQGNKVYGPEACIFVSRKINNLLNDRKASRGRYPQGVSLHNASKGFISRLNIDGKPKHLGYFSSSESASEAYRTAKYELIAEIALTQDEPLRTALLNYRIEPY